MDGYGTATYGDAIADVYDAWWDELPGTGDAADTLAALAGGGRALELAIGTGRIALPLAARGIEVHGIDSSEEMVRRLRSKPGGADIPVTIGDFADVDVDGPFRLIFVAFNTLFHLKDQDEQVRCFQNVANHLSPDGAFVIEAFVPDPRPFLSGTVSVPKVEIDRVQFDVTTVDLVAQRSDAQHLVIDNEGIHFFPISVRWAYPAELDLMGRLAGLRLDARWSDWRGDPFTSSSTQHVSVYRLA